MLEVSREQESAPRPNASRPWAHKAAQASNRPSKGTAPSDQRRRPTKMSVGIILCRKNQKTGRLEVLLVKKRFTYAYAEFIHGRYVREGARARESALRDVATLLDNMTREELLDIWSLNFAQMWYRAWLLGGNRDMYNKKAAKFQSTFMREDGGAALHRMITQARANGEALWEVPKGRRLHAREGDVFCAVRELREETGVDKSEYRILPGVKRRVNYVSVGVRYTCVYYVALANPNLAARESLFPTKSALALREMTHMAEIGEACWKDIEQIRSLSKDGHLARLVTPAFSLVKKYLRGKWAHVGSHARVPRQATAWQTAATQAAEPAAASQAAPDRRQAAPQAAPDHQTKDNLYSPPSMAVRRLSATPAVDRARPQLDSARPQPDSGRTRPERARAPDQQKWPRAVRQPLQQPPVRPSPVAYLDPRPKREKTYKPRAGVGNEWHTVSK
jgi:8-oxo-dGTP pyrophosphatase MutT (NUDIX family)